MKLVPNLFSLTTQQSIPFFAERYFAKWRMWCKDNEYCNRKKNKRNQSCLLLECNIHLYWPLWPFWEKSLPLGRAVAARQWNTTRSNSLQMPGTGSFKGKNESHSLFQWHRPLIPQSHLGWELQGQEGT